MNTVENDYKDISPEDRPFIRIMDKMLKQLIDGTEVKTLKEVYLEILDHKETSALIFIADRLRRHGWYWTDRGWVEEHK